MRGRAELAAEATAALEAEAMAAGSVRRRLKQAWAAARVVLRQPAIRPAHRRATSMVVAAEAVVAGATRSAAMGPGARPRWTARAARRVAARCRRAARAVAEAAARVVAEAAVVAEVAGVVAVAVVVRS